MVKTAKRGKKSSAGLNLCNDCKTTLKQNKARKTPRRKHKRHHQKSNDTNAHNPYSRNIYRLLKCIFPDLSISRLAVSVMNSFVVDLFDRIAAEASTLVYLSKKQTMGHDDIISATKLVITSPELCGFAIDMAHRTIEWSEKQ